eukprot:5718746-Amphidinium_carterae.1
MSAQDDARNEICRPSWAIQQIFHMRLLSERRSGLKCARKNTRRLRRKPLRFLKKLANAIGLGIELLEAAPILELLQT